MSALGHKRTYSISASITLETKLREQNMLDHASLSVTDIHHSRQFYDATLRPLEESIARGITPAEELLEKFHGQWNDSVEPIFEEYAY